MASHSYRNVNYCKIKRTFRVVKNLMISTETSSYMDLTSRDLDMKTATQWRNFVKTIQRLFFSPPRRHCYMIATPLDLQLNIFCQMRISPKKEEIFLNGVEELFDIFT